MKIINTTKIEEMKEMKRNKMKKMIKEERAKKSECQLGVHENNQRISQSSIFYYK